MLILFLFLILALFLLSHKEFVDNFQFLKIDKVIMSNQNLDDKLIMECVRFKIGTL